MDFKPRLDSKAGLAIALASVGVVYATYSHFMPSVIDHRVGKADDPDAAAAERTATWTATGIVAALFLVTMEPMVFMMGGGSIALLGWSHKHANVVNPLTSKATVAASMASTAATANDQNLGTQYDGAMESGMY